MSSFLVSLKMQQVHLAIEDGIAAIDSMMVRVGLTLDDVRNEAKQREWQEDIVVGEPGESYKDVVVGEVEDEIHEVQELWT